MGDRILVLVRHGQSEWNLKNLFTGWRDVGLTENGVAEARAAGRTRRVRQTPAHGHGASRPLFPRSTPMSSADQ